jgi:hypothetical protein
MMSWATRPKGHSVVSAAIAIGLGVALSLTLVVGLPELTKPVTTCALGSEIDSAWIWTPGILVNVPDGGSASWSSVQLNWTFSSGSLVVGALPGPKGGSSLFPGSNEYGINGDIGLADWGIYQARNASSAFGANSACTQPFVAESLSPLSCGAVGNLSSILVLPDNSSDVQELHVVPPQPCSIESATPGAEVWFDTSYHPAGTGGSYQSETISLCGSSFNGPLNVSLPGVAEYPIEISMPHDGTQIRASGFLAWAGLAPNNAATAAYSLPKGWTWNVSAVVPGVLPTVSDPVTTSLLAFERLAC